MKKKCGNILVVDDDKDICSLISNVLIDRGYSVLKATDGLKALEILKKEAVSIIISDVEMPNMDGITLLREVKKENSDIEVIIITGFGTIEYAVEAMKLGAYDFILKPLNFSHLLIIVERIFNNKRLLNENLYLLEELSQKYHFNTIIGQSSEMMDVYEKIEKVSKTDATVLITGESGTGKELVAGAIHYLSRRKGKPFVKLSCAALSQGTIESELFGHEKGAFTSAISKTKGRFGLADGGTVFLDEIGDISISTQLKLLRVLETREFERVGGTETIKVDIRLISATNQNLEKLVAEKKFREDLFYRLNVVSIHVPALRDRNSDIELLVNHFLQKYSLETNKRIHGISKKAMTSLKACPWTGNVRELENVIERAVVFCQDTVIKPEHLPEQLKGSENSSGITLKLPSKSLEIAERTLIKNVIDETNGNMKKAADILGVSRSTLYSKIEKLGLKKIQKR
ncbi:sigma-54 dependent transcriptional regulator [bacterium]|nr:sigma-54 dependent transcriptional regulator [bacterium]MBU1635605.1 sigma-54 dependent transcriptional regulator [bacterium]MBU1872455.1 sigma-54 dependent transcriptional regulator [bacterium]